MSETAVPGFPRPISELRPGLVGRQTASPDDALEWDGSAFVPRDRTKRSVRVFNITDAEFGGIGDDRADNTDPILRVLEAAKKESPDDASVIYFPPGVYRSKKKTNNAILIEDLSNVTFRGDGMNSSVLKKDGSGVDFTFIDIYGDVSYLAFENMTLDGGQTGATTPFSSDSGTGDTNLILCPPGAGNGVTNFRAKNCLFRNSWGGGIYIYGAADVDISGCSFYALDQGDVNNAITFVSSLQGAEPYLGGISVRGNMFWGNGQVGVAVAAVALPIGMCNIVDNRFYSEDGSNGVGWEVVAPDTVTGINIIGNQTYGVAGGTVQGNDVTVIGNIVRHCTRATPDGNGIQINDAGASSRIIIAHNVLDGGTDSGIEVRGTDVLVQGNIVTGFNRGVYVKADATNARILDNTLTGNTTALTDSGTGTEIRGNKGVTAGSYTATKINYTAFTSPVTISSTTEATPTDVVSSGAITYDGSEVLIEFFSPEVTAPISDFIAFNLWDASTNLGYLISMQNPDATNPLSVQVSGTRQLTPSVGSHTYKVRAYSGSGSGTINAGAGGSAGTYVPGFIRITKV